MKEPTSQVPLISDLVLIGGGHAHVHILKMAGMEPLKSTLQQNGIQITLISSTTLTPYSGMLPGYISGHYSSHDIHLDLRKLCSFGNVRFIHASAVGVTYNHHSNGNDDTTRGFVQLSNGRPDIRYDALSIDIGSSPSLPNEMKNNNNNDDENNNGTKIHITPVKPIATFSQRWENICNKVKSAYIHHHDNSSSSQSGAIYTPSDPFRLVVVGGGAGGLELALSAQFALLNIMNECTSTSTSALNHDNIEDCIKVSLITRGKDILSSHNESVRKIFKRILKEKKIDVYYCSEVIGIQEGHQDESNHRHCKILKLSTSLSTMTENNHSHQQQQQQENEPIYFHECLFCTSANASSWLTTNTPFDTTTTSIVNDGTRTTAGGGGFVKVKDTYECINHPGVFAVGDCCHLVNSPRPKAGVFAVRAGPIVKDNLIAYLLNKPLIEHKPQSQFLGLISTGEKYAVASRGDYAIEGQFLWTLKDEIDRTWMDGYMNLPDMMNMENGSGISSNVHGDSSKSDNGFDSNNDGDENNDEKPSSSSLVLVAPPSLSKRGPDALAAFAEVNMRCGGCGAKVGSTTLTRVLDAVYKRRVERSGTNNVKPRKVDPDDAAIVPLPAGSSGGGAMIHTIDFFRSFISDPYIFGKIAAVHALSDVHAMGATVMNALALAVVPFAATESMTEHTLIDMLSGASDIFDEENCEMIGGHTCEGAELSLGFTVNGYINNTDLLLRKQGGKVGDKIVLSKPIGTGALFAADMRAKARGIHVDEALLNMSMSNRLASSIAMKFNSKDEGKEKSIRSATDITGFGLVGHLTEMLIANDNVPDDADKSMQSISAILFIEKIPFLEGGIQAVKNGIVSSLYRENFRSRRAVGNHSEAFEKYPIKYPLLFDPQTAGGLLFFVDPDCCEDFVDDLKKHGMNDTSVIGELSIFNLDYVDRCDQGTKCFANQGRVHIL